MGIRKMEVSDIPRVLPLYLSYYNDCEGGRWTEETAGKRIHQVLTMEDSFSLIWEEGEILGFAMGYFKQYDDIRGYTLEEILISRKYQHRGFGKALLKALEAQVKTQGAACMELQAVKDDFHERFYTAAGYHTAVNFTPKVKWFE